MLYDVRDNTYVYIHTYIYTYTHILGFEIRSLGVVSPRVPPSHTSHILLGYEEMEYKLVETMATMMQVMKNQTDMVARMTASNNSRPRNARRRVNSVLTKFIRKNWLKYFSNEALVHTFLPQSSIPMNHTYTLSNAMCE